MCDIKVLMAGLSHDQIGAIFLENIKNAIEAPFELPEGKVYNKEGSIRLDGGIRLTVHSDDHDTHFHILHRERGNNARFSFPDIRFKDYKYSKKPFTERELKNIITTCKVYSDFIKRELEKRN